MPFSRGKIDQFNLYQANDYCNIYHDTGLVTLNSEEDDIDAYIVYNEISSNPAWFGLNDINNEILLNGLKALQWLFIILTGDLINLIII